MGSSESSNGNNAAAAANREPTESPKGSCDFDWSNIKFDDARSECGKCVYSSEFKPKSSDGPTWRLQLYPRGYTDQLKDYIAIFLQLLSNDYDQRLLYVNFNVKLFSDKRELAERKQLILMQSERPEGWFMFLKRSDIPNVTDCKKSCCMLSCQLSLTYWVNKRSYVDSASIDGELSVDLLRLYKNSHFSDVTLRVDGQEIKAHMIILAARSPVLSCIFMQLPEIDRCVDIPDVSFENCERFLEFCYTGKPVYFPTVYSAMELYAVAKKFAVYALMNRCVRFITCNYDVKNAVDVLVFADKYDEQSLKKLGMEFISHNFKDIGQTSSWDNTVNENPLLGTEVLHRVATTFKKT